MDIWKGKNCYSKKETIGIAFFVFLLISLISCNHKKNASEILNETIETIDTIESIYYKQDMSRTNPRNQNDTIFRFREMYFKRLKTDSIVGVKGHWYMYIEDKENVIYEDVFDGNRLVRKNNRDSTALIYDLLEYPEFREKHFWSHNTLYGMQHEFRFYLKNSDSYSIKRLEDSIINGKDCYQIIVQLENKKTMPGFAIALEDNEGTISKTSYFIDKQTLYPIRMKGVSYSSDSPENKIFIDQKYFDIEFNLKINENDQFNTSTESLNDFEISIVKPD